MNDTLNTLQLRHTILMGEMQLHSKLAKTLESLLRQELSRVQECFQEMETFSVELLRLQTEEFGELEFQERYSVLAPS